MKNLLFSISLAALLLLSGCGRVDTDEPVNVIFIVPDGLSPAVWSAVRVMSVGYDGLTHLDRMPHLALFSTWANDSWITCSAASITAMMTGRKTNFGIIDQDSTAVYKESPGADLESLMEYAAGSGMATGIITTCTIYHATPAGCYAHHYNRNSFEEIAAQLLDGKFTPDIIMGGGRKYMRPPSYMDPEEGEPCARTDYRDLAAELEAEGYRYMESLSDFTDWQPESERKALGLFEYQHMRYEIDRKNDKLGEPGLWEMTEKGLKALANAPKGFFLLIEAARIDHAAHWNAPDSLIYDCIAFDKTVGVAREFLAKHPNTLVLIAADHGTGNPAGIGFINDDGEIKPYNTLVKYDDSDGDRFPDNLKIETPLVLGWASSPVDLRKKPKPGYVLGDHTGDDCIAFAAGVGSHLVGGFMDNTDLYNIMKFVLPAENTGQGVVIDLNAIETEKTIVDNPPGTALFSALINPGATWSIEISGMNGVVLSEKEMVSGSDGKVSFLWQPKKQKIKLPGLFSYTWYVDGEFLGRHTFIVR